MSLHHLQLFLVLFDMRGVPYWDTILHTGSHQALVGCLFDFITIDGEIYLQEAQWSICFHSGFINVCHPGEVQGEFHT